MEILLPSQVKPSYSCACGKQFYSKPAGIRHTASCTEAAEIAERTVAHMNSNTFTGTTDIEVAEWKSKRLSEGKRATNDRGSLA